MLRFIIVFFTFFLFFLSLEPVSAEEKIQINEFLVHPGGENKEWVELYIPDGKNCAGYWIDDDTDFESDTGNGKKYHIEQCADPLRIQYHIVELPTALLNNTEDSIILFDPTGNVEDQYTYTSDPGIDISIGRNPDSIGSFYPLLSATKGAANTLPIPTQTPTPTPTIRPTREPTTEPTPQESIPTSATYFEPTDFRITPFQQVRGSSTTSKLPVNTKTASNGAYPTVILLPAETIEPTKIHVSPTGVVMVKSAAKIGSFYTILGGFSLTCCAILMFIKR